jgi:tRNA-2-methylthio-N6-dimethylallyladenosine synthase
MKRKLYLETFGCQMNVLDSELVLSQLRAQGYESTDDRDTADVVIFNTCSVREHAEQKVWSRLGELRETKAERPDLVIGVIGCMAEREGESIFGRFPHIDILCGPGELDKLPAMVHNACITAPPSLGTPGKGRGEDSYETVTSFDSLYVGEVDDSRDVPIEVVHKNPHPGPPPEYRERMGKHIALMGNTTRRSSTYETAKEDNLESLDLSRTVSPGDDVRQAYVRITRGCNKFCAYCVVPFTRGPEVHRPPGNIVDEVKMLVDAGVLEVTLLGQTINHYLFDHGGGRKTTFADLLYQIHESVPDLPRLRFVTSFPRDFTDAALQAMRDCSRICRYLHVPAQSGSDRILKAMNRGYTAQQYLDFIDRARGYMPDVSLASDFIVGYPTETDDDFAKTVELVKYCRFKNSFVFKYSPRPGTVAIDRFEDDVPEDVKRIRNNQLLAVQGEICADNNRQMVGKTVDVMVEGESKLVSKRAYPSSKVTLGWESRQGQFIDPAPTKTQLVGRTRGDQVVCFDGELQLKGSILNVEIVDAKNLTLFGKVVESTVII